MKRILSILTIAVTASVSCVRSPSPCEFELVFDSTRDGSTEVYSMDLDTLAVRQLTDSANPEIANRFPDWSSDGMEIVFVSENSEGLGNLYIVTADGSNLRQLTSDLGRYENPAWAPDTDWIAFEKGKGDDWGLYLIRPDGSELHRIEGENLFHPSWSVDEERLAIVTGQDPDWFGATLSLSSAQTERFTPPELAVGSVKWAPDGRGIAFDAVVGENFDLFIMDELGSIPERLTDLPATDARPEWSPDGTRLVFHSTRDFGSVPGDRQWSHFELYVMDLRNKDVMRLTDNEVFDAHPDWCSAP